MKTLFSRLLLCVAFLSGSVAVWANTPDDVVRETSRQVLDTLKRDNGKNTRTVRADVETLVLPKFDFTRMTALAVGRGWRDATPEQQKLLMEQFRTLLVRTYSSTMTRFKSAQDEVKPAALSTDGNEATVHTEVTLPAGTGDKRTASVDYTLIKLGTAWRVYNVSIEGASLVTIYRNNFNDVIRQNGVDGLIQSLKEKNEGMAAKGGNA